MCRMRPGRRHCHLPDAHLLAGDGNRSIWGTASGESETLASRASPSPLLDIGAAHAEAADVPEFSVLLRWLDSHIASPHPDLGRVGAVCPYTRRAARREAIRLAVSRGASEATAFGLIRSALLGLEDIDVPPAESHLRVILLAFPDCNTPEGIALLGRAVKRLRLSAMVRRRMIGFMHPHAEAGGLWNPDFRPLRAPLPVVAVRCLIEADAPFIARQHMQWGPYLLRYGWSGAKRILAYRSHLRERSARGSADHPTR